MTSRKALDSKQAKRDTYTLTVDLSNAAFDGNTGRLELAEVLDKAAARVRAANFGDLLGEPNGWRVDYPKIARDINGNTVANARTTEGPPSDDSIPVNLKADALAAALAVLLLDSVTRATLDVVDPQAVRQAVEAMGEYGGRKGKFIAQFKPERTARATIEDRLILAEHATNPTQYTDAEREDYRLSHPNREEQ